MKTKILQVKKLRITSGFGDRIHPVTGAKKFHNGIDIACPVGTPVLSPVSATVANAYNDTRFGGGLTLILRDNLTDDRYGFAHLSKINCETGDIIQQGQEIARSGNTGCSTGAHLHFTHSVDCEWKGERVVKHTYVDPIDKIEFEII